MLEEFEAAMLYSAVELARRLAAQGGDLATSDRLGDALVTVEQTHGQPAGIGNAGKSGFDIGVRALTAMAWQYLSSHGKD